MALWAGELDRRRASKAPLVQTPSPFPTGNHGEPQRQGNRAAPRPCLSRTRAESKDGVLHCADTSNLLLAPCLPHAVGKQPPYHTIDAAIAASISTRLPTVPSYRAPHGSHLSSTEKCPPCPSLLTRRGVPPALLLQQRVPKGRLPMRVPPDCGVHEYPALPSASSAAPET